MCLGIAFASFAAYAFSGFQTKFIRLLSPEADLLAKKSVRAYGLVPFFAIAIGVPLAWACFWTGSVWTHLMIATPLMFCILNLISLGGGPTTAGILIDMFGQTDSDLLSIRKAMTIVFGAGLIAALFFFLASRTLPKDWAIAEARNEG